MKKSLVIANIIPGGELSFEGVNNGTYLVAGKHLT
jgi:hypothetical protein